MVRIVCVISWMVVAGVLLGGGGCTATRAPELQVQQATWGEQHDGAQRVDVFVVLRNPTTPREETAASGSGGAVRVLEVQYDVTLDGQPVYRGRWDARATLAAGTERRLTLPVVVRLDGPPHGEAGIGGGEGEGEAASFRVSGQVLYLPDDRLSEILVDLGWQHRRVGFAGRGRVGEAGRPPVE